MKTLKIGILSLALAFAGLASAQQSPSSPSSPSQNQAPTKTPEERATGHSKRLTKELGLTADQEKSVYNFCLQHAQTQDADRIKYQNDKEAMRNAHKQNNQTFDTNMGTVLTPDQKTKFEQIRQEEKAKREQNKGQNP